MAVSVQMPKQGNTVEECLLVEWKVKVGDSVKTGDVLCSIETDKASFDVESTADGVVLKLLANAGDLVPVLTDIAIIGQPGEATNAAAPAPAAKPAEAPAAQTPAAALSPAPAAKATGASASVPGATAVQMPKQGNTVEECLLVEWKVKVGDKVNKGDVLCSIETDKASFDVESTAGGVVLKLLANAGDLVPVLSDIALIGEAGTNVDAAAAPAPAAKTESATVAYTAPAPVPAPAAKAAAPQAKRDSADSANAVSPRARKLADKFSFDPSGVAGTGIDGRVTSRDIQKLIDKGEIKRSTPLAREVMTESGKSAGEASGIGGMVRARDLIERKVTMNKEKTFVELAPEIVPYKGIRKLIGDRMLGSLQDHAQLTLNSSADATSMMGLRKKVKQFAGQFGLPNLTINDMVCWVVAQTLPKFPEVNATLDRKAGTFTQHNRVNLGIAVDTPRGLIVPVIADAHRMSISELSRVIGQYAADSRTGKIKPDLLSGGTFTISNLGGLGIETFTPILNAPQAAILGVCAVRDTAARASDGSITLQPRMGLSITIDHQIVDGAPGARFLQQVVKGLENIEATLAMLGAI